MDLWQLHIFRKVVECGSFSKAGESVHLSQPTVSSHIKELEAHVGCRLIDRLPKRAIPTKAGELLYSYACRLISLRDEAEAAITAYQGAIKGQLFMGGSTIPGVYVLPRIIGAFSRKYPDVRVCLEIGDTDSIIDDTISGRLEVGVVGAQSEDSRILQEPLLQDELRLVVSPDHRWAEKAQVTLGMLQKEPFISREQGSGTLKTIQLALARRGHRLEEFNILWQMGSTEAIREAIKNNLGVSILSRLAVAEDLDSGRLKAVDLEGTILKRRFYLTRARHRTLSPAAGAFIEYLLQ
jgi:DNA-binding transcriptional LysR family regulator